MMLEPYFDHDTVVDNTGDITKTANIRDFAGHVMKETGGQGLHVVLADGVRLTAALPEAV